MKTTHAFFAVLLVLSVAQPIFGQTEKIALYADAWGSDCSITDTAPGVVEVHMIHIGSVGSTGASFRAPAPACWTGAIWLGDVISPFLTIGTTQGNFIDVGYSTCLVSPIHIGRMNFYSAGTGGPCCEYPVLPSTGYPTAVSVDCAVPFGNLVAIGGGSVMINENSNCLCDPPLAVEETTWGRVKALYH